MNENIQTLANRSLEIENDFSSSSHAMDCLAFESIKEEFGSYTIPFKYNKDALVVLPINTSNFYIYWEITDGTLEYFGINLNEQTLQFRVMNSHNQTILAQFESPFALGEYFVLDTVSSCDMVVVMGVNTPNGFKELLISNTIASFNTTITLPKENEVWLEKYTYHSKIIEKYFLADASCSSLEYVKQLEQLKIMNSRNENMNSKTHLKAMP